MAKKYLTHENLEPLFTDFYKAIKDEFAKKGKTKRQWDNFIEKWMKQKKLVGLDEEFPHILQGIVSDFSGNYSRIELKRTFYSDCYRYGIVKI